MRIAGINYNDVANGQGVCISLFFQGCEKHCKGCFNPETWDRNGGQEIDREGLIQNIISHITDNGIQRNFCLLGGDPLEEYNRANCLIIVKSVRAAFPNIKIYLWTGFLYEQVKDLEILQYVDFLIDGPFIEPEKDLRLKMRGSRNQRIIDLNKKL